MPSLTGRGQQRPGTLYAEYFHEGRTPSFQVFAPAHRGRVRNQMQTIYLDGYKGIRYDVKSADDDFEIFDLGKDPQEALNLAGKPKLAGLQAAMKARVLQVRKPDDSAKRPYDSALVPPVETTPASAPGLSWSLYTGEWPWMPDFRTLSPTSRGKSKGVELSMATTHVPFGVAFEGFFHAAQDGEYTFTLDSDTGAMLFLHDIRVIEEPLKKPAGKYRGKALLKSGWHPLRLYYRHGAGQPRLEFAVQDPAGKPLNLDDTCLRQTETI